MRPGQIVVEYLASMFYQGGPNADSVTGDTVKFREGWINPDVLKNDIARESANVTVWGTSAVRATGGIGADGWKAKSISPASIVATVAGDQVTFTGVVQVPQVVDLLVDGRPYAYPIESSDTLSSIAASLAGLTGGTADATILTIPGAREIRVRLVTQGQIAKTLRREERVYQVITWAATPEQRDRVGDLVDGFLSEARRLPGLNLTYAGGHDEDEFQRQGAYRRILQMRIESAVEITQSDWTIGIGHLNRSNGPTLHEQGPVQTTYS